MFKTYHRRSYGIPASEWLWEQQFEADNDSDADDLCDEAYEAMRDSEANYED